MPLNIDWQQILLHWMNLVILTGGLHFLLFKPVKEFMAKREKHYQELAGQAEARLAEAEQLKAECQAKLDKADDEIHQERAKAQQAIQQSTEDQLAQAKEQARQIVAHARAEALSSGATWGPCTCSSRGSSPKRCPAWARKRLSSPPE